MMLTSWLLCSPGPSDDSEQCHHAPGHRGHAAAAAALEHPSGRQASDGSEGAPPVRPAQPSLCCPRGPLPPELVFRLHRLSHLLRVGETYYRVVLIGEQGVGKSTLANIFAGVHDSMDSDCEVLGEDTYERTLIVDGESATIILLDMWENKGENEWLQDHCMQVGDAYLIVYSITDRASFEKASELRIQLRRARQTEDIPIILVGNKSDLVRCREVSVSEGRACAVVFDCKFIETSAAVQHNVRSCLRASCGRSAFGGTARRRMSGGWPTRKGGRASPGKPGASGARSWPKTTRIWPSSSSPNPAMTSLCSRHPESPRCPPDGCHRNTIGTDNLY
uniref:GTP binding protein overexpressed in skeletal muscle n=1 Tax=Lynx canadensis TaxID=61383 RepID=A0A667HY08_LYNCA